MIEREKFDLNELDVRIRVTAEQGELLLRALCEAEDVKDPDVFLRAHIAALISDVNKLKQEHTQLREIKRRSVMADAEDAQLAG
jgi:hypothetical protein